MSNDRDYGSRTQSTEVGHVCQVGVSAMLHRQGLRGFPPFTQQECQLHPKALRPYSHNKMPDRATEAACFQSHIRQGVSSILETISQKPPENIPFLPHWATSSQTLHQRSAMMNGKAWIADQSLAKMGCLGLTSLIKSNF